MVTRRLQVPEVLVTFNCNRNCPSTEIEYIRMSEFRKKIGDDSDVAFLIQSGGFLEKFST